MILGRTRKLIQEHVPLIDVKLAANIHNRFDLEVVDSVTGEVKQRAQAENVICNGLWNCLFDGNEYPSRYFSAISFGTGAGVPAAANTALFTPLGSKGFPSIGWSYIDSSTYVINNDYENHVYSAQNKIQLLETEYNGSTITELGVSSLTQGTLCTHAMLKDMNGNPISIAKTNTDIINIYATIFVHWQDSYNGNRINNYYLPLFEVLTGRAGYGVGQCLKSVSFKSGIGYYDSQTAVSKSGTITYDIPNKKATIVYPRLAASEGNFGQSGIGFVSIADGEGNGIFFDQAFATPFDIVSESVATADGVLKDFSTSFGYLNSGDTTVFVDGVAASGVTVDADIPVGGLVGKSFVYSDANGIVNISKPPHSCFSKVISSGNSDNDFGGYATTYAYNPYYETLGLNTIKHHLVNSVYCSNDCVTWVSLNELVTPDGTISNGYRIPEAFVHYKYWKLVAGNNYSYESCNWKSDHRSNIHFATAPANGAVITASYKTKRIPKDINHVFDFSITMQFGEHTT